MSKASRDKGKEVWMYGGGVQSCAIAALITQGKVPPPDIAVIADTGREKQSTWDYLRNVVQPAINFQIEIVKKDDFATVDIWRGDTSLLPSFSNIKGDTAKLPTYCSNEWKKRVIERWLRKIKGVKKFVKWIGFSLDEARRVIRMRKSGDAVYFPLIETVPINRHECVSLVEKMGWPTPPRSACWMCPNMNHGEWQDLKENSPSEFAAAVALEVEVRAKDPHAFFHRSCKPLDQVDFEREPDLFSRPCDSGLCFT